MLVLLSYLIKVSLMLLMGLLDFFLVGLFFVLGVRVHFLELVLVRCHCTLYDVDRVLLLSDLLTSLVSVCFWLALKEKVVEAKGLFL